MGCASRRVFKGGPFGFIVRSDSVPPSLELFRGSFQFFCALWAVGIAWVAREFVSYVFRSLISTYIFTFDFMEPRVTFHSSSASIRLLHRPVIARLSYPKDDIGSATGSQNFSRATRNTLLLTVTKIDLVTFI